MHQYYLFWPCIHVSSTCELDTVMLQYFAGTLLLRTLRVPTASQVKDRNKYFDLWEWLLVGVVITNECTIDDKSGRALPAAVMEDSAAS